MLVCVLTGACHDLMQAVDLELDAVKFLGNFRSKRYSSTCVLCTAV